MSAGAASGSIGVLGGAFNPPHLGHLALAQAARDQLGLTRVLLMVTGRAPHKRIDPEPGPEVRLELTREACRGMKGIEASALEVERAGESFTSDTLEVLAGEQPGSDLWLICGSDIAETLPKWHRPELVCELASLAVALRPGSGTEGVERALTGLDVDPGKKLRVLELEPREVSSTEIRRRCAAGESIDGLVPAPVADAIERDGLYL